MRRAAALAGFLGVAGMIGCSVDEDDRAPAAADPAPRAEREAPEDADAAAIAEPPPPRVVISDGGIETTIHEVERTPTPTLLPVSEVARRVARGDAVVCDVNVDEARAYYGVIPGARTLSHPSHFALSELPADRDVPLIFYCSTPSCGASLQSGTRAILAGYTEVYAMSGGIAAWIESGRETERP